MIDANIEKVLINKDFNIEIILKHAIGSRKFQLDPMGKDIKNSGSPSRLLLNWKIVPGVIIFKTSVEEYETKIKDLKLPKRRKK